MADNIPFRRSSSSAVSFHRLGRGGSSSFFRSSKRVKSDKSCVEEPVEPSVPGTASEGRGDAVPFLSASHTRCEDQTEGVPAHGQKGGDALTAATVGENGLEEKRAREEVAVWTSLHNASTVGIG